MLTSRPSVIEISQESVLLRVATYSIRLAKTPSSKSKPVPKSSTVVPIWSCTRRPALNVAEPEVTVTGRWLALPPMLMVVLASDFGG
jgi:hypothetical protein